MKFILIALLLPAASFAQDTSKANLLVKQDKNHYSKLTGYVVTVKDADSCKAVAYLVIDRLFKKPVFKPLPGKFTVVDYDILPTLKPTQNVNNTSPPHATATESVYVSQCV